MQLYSEDNLCDFGCNQVAKFKLKNGKLCCSQSPNSCKAIKKRNSDSISIAHKEKRIPGWGELWRENKNKSWNKGETKETDERIRLNGQTISAALKEKSKNGLFKLGGCFKWTVQKRKAWSLKQSRHHTGGRCKWFIIGKQSVQGTWERDVALQMNKLNIVWIKKKIKTFKFENNKKHHYTPDFYLPEFNIYLEIKGYWREYDKMKMKLVLEQNLELNKILYIVEQDKFKKLLKTENKEKFLNLLKAQ